MTLVLVDDDAQMLARLTDALGRHRINVSAYSRGEEALAAVRAEPVDAVVVDKEMPGMGGFEMLQALRAASPGIPVIVITAFGGRRVADEAHRRGASGYLEKPFRVLDLVTMLRSFSTN